MKTIARTYQLETLQLSQISFGDRVRDPLKDPTMNGYLKELADSIKEHGLITPLCVRSNAGVDPAGSFFLLAGGCRFRALEQLGISEAPCLIFTHDLTSLQIKRIELEENIKRKAFSPAEEAKAYREIHEAFIEEHGQKRPGAPGYDEKKGWGMRDTANHLGVSIGTISEAIKLAKVIEKMPEAANLWETKTEAIRALQKIERQKDRAIKVKEIEKQAAGTPLELKQRALANSFLIKDFFEAAKSLPAESFNLAEVDPPYGIELHELRKNAEETMTNYTEADKATYRDFLQKTIKECWRLLKPDGWMIFWFGPEPHQQLVLETIQAAGFSVRNLPAIWKKGAATAESNTGGGLQANAPEYYLARAWEPFFYARKGNAKILKMGTPDVFEFSNVSGQKRVHPTERPIELIETILKTFTEMGSQILVPFAGSGNTILAAANYSCKAIGFDLSKQYRDGFIERVYGSEPGKYRSY